MNTRHRRVTKLREQELNAKFEKAEYVGLELEDTE